jgi:purine-binding chemotaxis protein CheW
MNGDRIAIDWDQVKRRLAASEQALERSLGDDPARLEAVYRRRAEQLAVRRGRVSEAAATEPVLVFGMGTERYGLPLRDLEVVLPFANCTPVPGARPELLGVTNVRGEVRSVVDLRRILELPEAPAKGSGYVLLVRHDDQVVGLRVDGLEKAQRVAMGTLVTTVELGTEAHGRYLKGLTPDRVIVLDTAAILNHPVFHAAS